jgi:hypothetical protein
MRLFEWGGIRLDPPRAGEEAAAFQERADDGSPRISVHFIQGNVFVSAVAWGPGTDLSLPLEAALAVQSALPEVFAPPGPLRLPDYTPISSLPAGLRSAALGAAAELDGRVDPATSFTQKDGEIRLCLGLDVSRVIASVRLGIFDPLAGRYIYKADSPIGAPAGRSAECHRLSVAPGNYLARVWLEEAGAAELVFTVR